MVSTLLANCVLKRRSAEGAGPFVTAPFVLYSEPWQGHWNVPDEYRFTMHCSWVQMAVIALKVSCAVRATRKFPFDVCTSAALPTDDNGDPSTFSVMALFATDPFMV